MLLSWRSALAASAMIGMQAAGTPAFTQPVYNSTSSAYAAMAIDDGKQFDGFPTAGDAINCTPNHWITPDQQSFDIHAFYEQITCATSADGSLKACRLVSGRGYSERELTQIGGCVGSYLLANAGHISSTVSFNVAYTPVGSGRRGRLYYPANTRR